VPPNLVIERGEKTSVMLPGMSTDNGPLWASRPSFKEVQYRTDANLVARQSVYAYADPRYNLPAVFLDLVSLCGDESVVDVGCGNGAYLAELARRGHRGRLAGVDLSAGMLAAAARRAPSAAVLAGDAAALPLRDHAAGLTVAAESQQHPGPPGPGRGHRPAPRQPAGQRGAVPDPHLYRVPHLPVGSGPADDRKLSRRAGVRFRVCQLSVDHLWSGSKALLIDPDVTGG
jgi:SAM-dependent methyltransferase